VALASAPLFTLKNDQIVDLAIMLAFVFTGLLALHVLSAIAHTHDMN
jgi:hypothetical protein